MTLTVTHPVTGSGMGPGIQMRVHSDIPATPDEYLQAILYNNGTGAYYASGRAVLVSSGSGLAVVTLGYDSVTGTPMNTLNPFGNFGAAAALGAAVDLELRRFDSGFVRVETLQLLGYFAWDPVSQAANFLAGLVGHDPMLDDILASVRKTWPGT